MWIAYMGYGGLLPPYERDAHNLMKSRRKPKYDAPKIHSSKW
jgi:hypothetical protein